MLQDIKIRTCVFVIAVKVAKLLAVIGALAGSAYGQTTPPQVLASVRIGAGGGCSGTIVAVGKEFALGVSASHCCSAIGAEVEFGNPDGTKGRARWLAMDKQKDIALFKCWAKDVIGVAPVAESLTVEGLTACGYPGGQGPIFKSGLAFLRQTERMYAATGNFFTYDNKSGTFASGDSGGGVFDAEGRLVYVMTHGDDNERIATCTHQQLIEFLDRHAPEFKKADCCNQGSGQWRPNPNIPIIKPPYDGRGPRPGDLDSDKDMAREIATLRTEVADLKKLVDQFNKQKPIEAEPGARGERGPIGPPGDAGTDGANATDAQVASAVRRWMEANADSLRGSDGKSGKVTLELVWSDGQKIASIPNLFAGSKVTLPLERVKEATQPRGAANDSR